MFDNQPRPVVLRLGVTHYETDLENKRLKTIRTDYVFNTGWKYGLDEINNIPSFRVDGELFSSSLGDGAVVYNVVYNTNNDTFEIVVHSYNKGNNLQFSPKWEKVEFNELSSRRLTKSEIRGLERGRLKPEDLADEDDDEYDDDEI